MNTGKNIIAGAVLTVLSSGYAVAQDSEFDLSAQRSEVQTVAAVPGHKVDHQGIIINPTPRQMSVDRSQALDITRGVELVDRKNKFAADVEFIPSLRKGGVKLSVDFGGKSARKAGVKELSGAYVLTIGNNGISVTGYDERGAFYGLQTLRQLLESPVAKDGQLPLMTVNDWPELPDRGVVEGFYGTPWSHEVRMSLIDFYGRHKMNVYLYGPKDDPYHSSPNWRKPYPEAEAADISRLIDACRRNRVDFVWAIHPGKDIKWNEEDYNNLVNKFNRMYDLGVRHFAIFFDDIEGEGTNPVRQTELLNRLTTEFVKAKGDVGSLTMCPTDYSGLWANPSPNGSLAVFGRTMDPSIKVFWTGDVVCSDLTPSTLEFVNSRIQRPAYYWWNFPVTDYARHILMQGPVYGLDTSLTAAEVCGVVSNPMEHGEASKLALYGVADYAWNPSAFNPVDNWERGLVELAPEVADAYRTFAIHSADTETGYRRDESWETTTFALADWTDAAAQALEAEFMRVEGVPAAMEKGCGNARLLGELRPWLTEFGKLGRRGSRAVELGRMFRSGADEAAFWAGYVGNIMSDDDRKAYDAHKSGTMKLQPFYENIMDDMAFGFLGKITGATPCDVRGIGSFRNSGTVLTKQMLDGDTATHYTSGESQRPGSWIGIDLRAPRQVSRVTVKQGRNSVDDVDYFDHAVLEYSADGRTWIPLLDDLQGQYDIDWRGDAVSARYVRLRRLDSERRNYASVRVFAVNQPDGDTFSLPAFDNSLLTSVQLDGPLSWPVDAGVKSYTLLTGHHSAPLVLRQLAADGSTVAESVVTDPYTVVTPASAAVTGMVLDGKAEIFEIVPVAE